MPDQEAVITITIDLQEPIELSDFVGLFGSLAQQFDDFLTRVRPDYQGEGRIFVKDVRHGSIVADLVPMMQILVDFMDKALVVKEFTEWVSARIGTYTAGKQLAEAKKSDLAEIADMVRAVANNKGGMARIEAVRYVDKRRETAFEMTFTTGEARRAIETLEAHKVELDKRETADRENVLMAFFQANVKAPELGKRTGEQVIIEAIDTKPKPIVYDSEMARLKIKSEIDAAGENVFRKGFFVDVNIEYLSGRIVAYRVKEVRDVIDLPTNH